LAFVPTIVGASIGFFGRARPASELMAIGLVGLAATLGIRGLDVSRRLG